MLNDPSMPEESHRRGGCLSLLLMFYVFVGGLAVFGGLVKVLLPGSSFSDTNSLMLTVWYVILGLFEIIFGLAAWQWKKWGVFGLVGVIVGVFLVNFNLNATLNIWLFIFPVIQIALVTYLATQKWDLFE